MADKLNTKVEILELDDDKHYGRFTMSPLERGYGTTIGNSLRRVLLSSLPGAAVASIKFDEGVPHEFSTVTGVIEDVPEIILNIKGIAIRRLQGEGEPVTLRLDVEGPKIVTAKDIQETTEVEIINKDHYICTVNGEGEIHMELVVVDGSGYALADANKNPDDPITTIAIDSLFTPVTKVNFSIENTRVQQITDYDKLILEVWTNGTITAQEAVAQGSQILISHLALFTELPDFHLDEEEEGEEENNEEEILLQKPIEDLDLSLRSYNCLKRAGLNSLGDILATDARELAKIRNFGKKSYSEVENMVKAYGFELEEMEEE
ncbi:DNA-directed RNA polymerase subunit alpha [Kallipyga gabonensis]|uniref:DNA-directed RNA polymerase subunit alpha n=1 Tax=Kallipyga gabonensis TaxID=1686287 RepID=UPI0006B616F3|nr:DNA-directed RNA polymerase subunit alpha [Kallipyga gabonensis]